MFKICMKNYFANLKYVFVALGVMFIALIIGAQTTVNISVKRINEMVAAIEETTDESDLSLEGIGDSFKATFDAIGDNLSLEVISGKQEPTKVEQSIGESIAVVVKNYVMYMGDILTFVAKAVAGIIVAIIIFFLIQILGLFTSSTLITIFGRYDIANDNIFKIILEQIVRALFVIIWIWVIVGVFFLNLTAGIIMLALFPLVYCFISLLGVWVTAKKAVRPKYTEYVTFVNVLVLLACNLLQILIGVAIAAIAYFLGGIIVAAVFGLALMVLAVSNVNLNAYAFLYKKAEISKALAEDKTVVYTENAPEEVKPEEAAPAEIEDVKTDEEAAAEEAAVATAAAEAAPIEEVIPVEVVPVEVTPIEVKPEVVEPKAENQEEKKEGTVVIKDEE